MPRKYDLEKRTTEFGKAAIRECRILPRDPVNDRIISQVVGSAGSIGANYREADDSPGKKDFAQRLRTARRQSKECIHWLDLILEGNTDRQVQIRALIREAEELKSILSAIIAKPA